MGTVLEEHGISKETQQMVEEDLKAAIFSAVFVAIGSGVPILPYLFLSHEIAWIVALGLAVVGAIILGIATGNISGIGVCKTAFRQVFGVAVASGLALLLNYYLVSMIE